MFKTSAYGKAKELAEQTLKSDSKYTEIQYWIWKLSTELKLKAEKHAQKYVSLCKSLSLRDSRAYSSDPWTCRRILEVENFVKKNNNPE